MQSSNIIERKDTVDNVQSQREEFPVGKRLRQIREACGFSQRHVAEKAGMAHRTIATIERDAVSPSVGTLKRIVDSLGLTLSDFFDSVEKNRDRGIVYRANELVELADGDSISYRRIGGPLDNRDILILKERYKSGSDTGAPYSHDAQEGGFVIGGRIELIVGNEKWTLNAGDAYYFDSRIPHRFQNPFDEPCEIVSAVSPPNF